MGNLRRVAIWGTWGSRPEPKDWTFVCVCVCVCVCACAHGGGGQQETDLDAMHVSFLGDKVEEACTGRGGLIRRSLEHRVPVPHT
jgi:hypothetical protein